MLFFHYLLFLFLKFLVWCFLLYYLFVFFLLLLLLLLIFHFLRDKACIVIPDSINKIITVIINAIKVIPISFLHVFLIFSFFRYTLFLFKFLFLTRFYLCYLPCLSSINLLYFFHNISPFILFIKIELHDITAFYYLWILIKSNYILNITYILKIDNKKNKILS